MIRSKVRTNFTKREGTKTWMEGVQINGGEGLNYGPVVKGVVGSILSNDK